MQRDKIAQKQIDGILLLGICVAVGHKAPEAGQLVPEQRHGLPIPPLPLKDS